MDSYKINLSEAELPQEWYNILPDLPAPFPPYLHPGTGQPITPQDLSAIFPMALIEQELSPRRWIAIPDEVRRIYQLWRPTPLHRARNLEAALKTPARIYYKDESVSPAGSHKPNTAVAQAYYNREAGIKRLATETGAGQWGSALSLACNYFGLECTVYMVKVSYYQKPYRRSLMQIWGAQVHPSPTDLTNAGRAIRAKDPDTSGSLGIAISEAVEDAASHDDTNYSLGSVLNHVMLHQTVIGLETKKQLALAGEEPDILIGCVGGGSNFAGFCFPFVPDKLKGKDLRFLGIEPTACPTLTRGRYTYDFGDTAGLTPLIMMHTLGHGFVPSGIHAGGLRYHGDAPLLSLLVKEKVIEARAYPQNPVFDAARLFAQTEGIVPAPETAHAVKAAVDEALAAREQGKPKVIVFNFSGHGFLDLAAYDAFLEGRLEDIQLDPEAQIQKALADLPPIPGRQ
jgi:tryptophan synthase beta chain